jgi:two-component system, NtrC family, response regulator AtoC
MEYGTQKLTRDELEREVAFLHKISTEINSTLDLDEICAIVQRTMADLFGFRHSLILLLDEDGKTLSVVASRGYREACSGVKVPMGTGVIGLAAQKRRILRVGNLGRRRSYAAAIRSEVERSSRAGELGEAPRLPGLPDVEAQIAIPLLIRDALVGVFSVECADQPVFSERDETRAGVVGNLAASAIHNALLYRRLARANEGLQKELTAARAGGGRRVTVDDIVGESKPMKQAKALLRKVAASPSSTVLLTGENGTGKDLAAKAIHCQSDRADAPFMNITCSALPEALLESELFGHEKGAFTDARAQKKGLLELADGGTVFLDEIGEMSLVLQAKLLRFLEEKAFRRVGGTKDVRVDLRIVAATNRDLKAMVKQGAFREDLYYRLRVLPVELPPLRQRTGDLALLLRMFLDQYRAEFRKNVAAVSPEALAHLGQYSWPGNVRELKNAVERAVLLAEGPVLRPEDFSALSPSGDGDSGLRLPAEGLSFEKVERDLVAAALERSSFNKSRAARLLGMDRDWVRYRASKYGLDRRGHPGRPRE